MRYVECKCLLGGVTTSQGIQLASNAGVRRFYRGFLRNVEQTNEAALPEAATPVDDIEASDAELFLARLQKQSCFLLHLAEGIDDRARIHFLALQLTDERWAITPQLAGIHCAGLQAADFAILARHGGAMVWSPLSNLLLYGKTADIAAAKAAGVRLGIGSDWSPSGSKNLLGELKVARLASAMAGGVVSDRELVAMATREAAAILRWDATLGSLEANKRADLIVITGQTGDPYAQLLRATETAIALVMINGIARIRVPSLMQTLSPGGESLTTSGGTPDPLSTPRHWGSRRCRGVPEGGVLSPTLASGTDVQLAQQSPAFGPSVGTWAESVSGFYASLFRPALS